MRLFIRAIPFWLWALTMGACLSAQDDEDEQPEIHPETSREKMAYALFRRIIHPMMQWRERPAGEPMSLEAPRYYSLSIEPEDDRLDPFISFQFTLDYLKDAYVYSDGSPNPTDATRENPQDFLNRQLGAVRMRVWEKLTLAFEQGFEGPMETFSVGTPIFLRTPTEYSDPSKYRKEDVLYKH